MMKTSGAAGGGREAAAAGPLHAPAWQLHTPCQIQCVGPSQSGKSQLILQLVRHQASVFDRPFRHIIYCAPGLTLDDDDDEDNEVNGGGGGGDARASPYLRDLKRACRGSGVTLSVSARLPRVEEITRLTGGRPVLMILDDILCFEPEDLRRIVTFSNLHVHHRNISCVYAVQNPFQKNSHLDLVTLSRNCTGRFLLYQTNDWKMLGTLNNQLFPDSRGFLTSCLLAARERGLNYIYVNTAPLGERPLPRRYMCYTNLFAEGGEGPIFFDLYRPPAGPPQRRGQQ